MQALNISADAQYVDTASPLETSAASALLASQVQAACAQACRAIAPAWPLDQSIAVNPHWARIGLPLREVAARMALFGGIHVFPPRQSQWQAWTDGRITSPDLGLALKNASAEL